MSDYTPTTGEVRAAYRDAFAAAGTREDEQRARAEFDRWLAQVAAEAEARGAAKAADRIAAAAKRVRKVNRSTRGDVPNTTTLVLAGYAQAEHIARAEQTGADRD